MEIVKTIKLSSGIFDLYSAGYLIVTMSEYAVVDVEEAINREKAFIELCAGKKLPFIFLTDSKLIDYTDEAREYMAINSKMDEIRKAEAFVVNNVGVRLFIENYLKKNPLKCPSGIFKTKEEALAWVQQYID